MQMHDAENIYIQHSIHMVRTPRPGLDVHTQARARETAQVPLSRAHSLGGPSVAAACVLRGLERHRSTGIRETVNHARRAVLPKQPPHLTCT